MIANGENPLGKFIPGLCLLVMPAVFYTRVFICNAHENLIILWKLIGDERLYEKYFLPIAFSQIFAMCLFESLFASNALLVTGNSLFVYLGVTCVFYYIWARRVGELNQVTSIIDDSPSSQVLGVPASKFKESNCHDPAYSAAKQEPTIVDEEEVQATGYII